MTTKRDIRKVASEIVFSAAVVDGCPYTVNFDFDNKTVFVSVEAYMNTEGLTRYSVEVSDGYETRKKVFSDTPDAIRYLSEKLYRAWENFSND